LAYNLANKNKNCSHESTTNKAAAGTVMILSKLPALRLSKRLRQVFVVVGLCAVFQTVGTNACDSTSYMIPAHEAAEESIRQKFIKRLMPVDPESTEAMLADRGLDGLDPSNVLS
jgi:hypothetical protein